MIIMLAAAGADFSFRRQKRSFGGYGRSRRWKTPLARGRTRNILSYEREPRSG
jgi:hypothetical protein